MSERETRRRKEELEHACRFLKKMNFVASNYERLRDNEMLIYCLHGIFDDEVKKIPEQIANYGLTALLTFAYIGAMALGVGAFPALFATSLTTIIVAHIVGGVLGAPWAFKLAESDAKYITYNLFRFFDPKPEQKAIKFMSDAMIRRSDAFDESNIQSPIKDLFT
jgi:hypothetical protein